jgi:hypothetical protein
MGVLLVRYFTLSIEAYTCIKLRHFTSLLEKKTLRNWRKHYTTNTFESLAATQIDSVRKMFLYNLIVMTSQATPT